MTNSRTWFFSVEGSASPEIDPGGIMKKKLGLAMALLLGVIIFTLQNTEMISIRFLFWQFSLSRALMLFLVLGIGILLGFLLGSYRRNALTNDADFSQWKDDTGRDA
ncbi:MAG: LapA family protein [Proteobacteria bacterium]|nr:LapA family protein [Pseudomonadota bacterium]MBU4294816.1 LapA family protein [Pseudomonadota bacterium]MCG2748094.1 LapA family protein [Desulfobulbaceae bacterium]